MQIKNEYYHQRFPKNQGSGDGNLFSFFVERNLELIAPNGCLCYVLPSALMFEEGSTKLRRYILSEFQMRFFYAFHNRDGIFDIHRDTRFALTQIVKSVPDADVAPIDTAFRVLDPMELDSPQRIIPYSLNTLERLSPEHCSIMEVECRPDLDVLAKCYAAFQPLKETWLDFRRELDMTNDKHLFIEQPSPTRLPLYEGKMIWQYDHQYDNARYWVDTNALHEVLSSKELSRMAADLKVNRNEAEKHLGAIRYEYGFIRLGFRAIANNTNERTLILSLLPKNCVVGNSIYVSIPKHYCLQADHTVGIEAISVLRLLFVLAWFNSLPADWLLRFMVEKNVNKTFVYRLPIPQPTDAEIIANPDYKQLVTNAALLTLAADWEDFADIAQLLNIQKKEVPAIDKACDKLRAENDQIVARLYGITDAEFMNLLKSFRVMADNRPEYITLLDSRFGNGKKR
jgi:hypothetical protein